MTKIAVVTGCASFIGVTFTKKLLEEGWFVYGIDKFTHVANISEIDNFINCFPIQFKFIKKDICNIERLPACDVIFNLAAESDVDIGIKDCSRFIKSNIDGVRNLLEIINGCIITRESKPLFFQVSTDEVYGDTLSEIFDESSPLNPSNPYAASKASADLLIQSWARTHGLDYIIARPSNNYGYFQYPEKLIPITVKNLLRNKKIKLHNHGTPVRTWTHSEDTADAFLTLYELAERNRVYNISSEYEQTNYETVRKIVNAFYFENTIKRDVPDLESHLDLSYSRPGQDVRYAISCEPLRKLQWRPHMQFDKEIIKLVKYYKEKGIVW